MVNLLISSCSVTNRTFKDEETYEWISYALNKYQADTIKQTALLMTSSITITKILNNGDDVNLHLSVSLNEAFEWNHRHLSSSLLSISESEQLTTLLGILKKKMECVTL